MKKAYYFILYTFLFFIYKICSATTYSALSKDDLSTGGSTIGVTGEGFAPIDQVFLYGKNLFFTILSIIVVSVFVYFGYVIITSKGNEEEYKTALKGFLYAIIGMAVIPLSWGIVKIITSLNF